MLNTFASQLSLTTRICHLLLYYPWLLFLLPLLCLYTYSCTVCFFFCMYCSASRQCWLPKDTRSSDRPTERTPLRPLSHLWHIHTYICTCEHKSLCGHILASLKYALLLVDLSIHFICFVCVCMFQPSQFLLAIICRPWWVDFGKSCIIKLKFLIFFFITYLCFQLD